MSNCIIYEYQIQLNIFYLISCNLEVSCIQKMELERKAKNKQDQDLRKQKEERNKNLRWKAQRLKQEIQSMQKNAKISQIPKIPENSNVCVFLGPSQTGKSTIVNLLLSKKINIPSKTSNPQIQINFEDIQNQIGNRYISGTTTPFIQYDSNSDCYYIDTPGFQHDPIQSSLKSYQNMRIVVQLLQNLQNTNMKVILVLKISVIMKKSKLLEILKVMEALFPKILSKSNNRNFGIIFTFTHEQVHLLEMYDDEMTAQKQLQILSKGIQQLIIKPAKQNYGKLEGMQKFKDFLEQITTDYIPSPIFFLKRIEGQSKEIYSLKKEQLQNFIDCIKQRINKTPTIQYESGILPFEKSKLNKLSQRLHQFQILGKELKNETQRYFENLLDLLSNVKDSSTQHQIFLVIKKLFDIFLDQQNNFEMDSTDIQAQKQLFGILDNLGAQQAKNNYTNLKNIAQILNILRPLVQDLPVDDLKSDNVSKQIINMLVQPHYMTFYQYARNFIVLSMSRNSQNYHRFISNELMNHQLDENIQLLRRIEENNQKWYEKKVQSDAKQYSFFPQLDYALRKAYNDQYFQILQKNLFGKNQLMQENIINYLMEKRYNIVSQVQNLTSTHLLKIEEVKQMTTSKIQSEQKNYVILMINAAFTEETKKSAQIINRELEANKKIDKMKNLDKKIYSSLIFKIEEFQRDSNQMVRNSNPRLPLNYRIFDPFRFLFELYEPYLKTGWNKLMITHFSIVQPYLNQEISNNKIIEVIGKILLKENINQKIIQEYGQQFVNIVSGIFSKFVFKSQSLQSSISTDLAIINTFCAENGFKIKTKVKTQDLKGQIMMGRNVYINRDINTYGGDLYLIGENIMLPSDKTIDFKLSASQIEPKQNRYDEQNIPLPGRPGNNSGNGFFMYFNLINSQNGSLQMQGGKGEQGQKGKDAQRKKKNIFPYIGLEDGFEFKLSRQIQQKYQNAANKQQLSYQEGMINSFEKRKIEWQAFTQQLSKDIERKQFNGNPFDQFPKLLQKLKDSVSSKKMSLDSFKPQQTEIFQKYLKKQSETKTYIHILKNYKRKYLPPLNFYYKHHLFRSSLQYNYEQPVDLSGYTFVCIYTQGDSGINSQKGGWGGHDGYNGILLTSQKANFCVKNHSKQGNSFMNQKQIQGIQEIKSFIIGNQQKYFTNHAPPGKNGNPEPLLPAKSLILAIHEKRDIIYGFFQIFDRDPYTNQIYMEGVLNMNVPVISDTFPKKPILQPLEIISIKIMSLLCQNNQQGFDLLLAFCHSKFLHNLVLQKRRIQGQQFVQVILQDLFDASLSWIKIIDNLPDPDQKNAHYLGQLVKIIPQMFDIIIENSPQKSHYNQKVQEYMKFLNYYIDSKLQVFNYIPVCADLPLLAQDLLKQFKQNEKQIKKKKMEQKKNQINQQKNSNILMITQQFHTICQQIDKEKQNINKNFNHCLQRCQERFHQQIQRALVQTSIVNHKLKSCRNIIVVLSGVQSLFKAALPCIGPIGSIVASATSIIFDKVKKSEQLNLQEYNKLQIDLPTTKIQKLNGEEKKKYQKPTLITTTIWNRMKSKVTEKLPILGQSKIFKASQECDKRFNQLQKLYLNDDAQEAYIRDQVPAKILSNFNKIIKEILALCKNTKINYVKLMNTVLKSKASIILVVQEIKEQLKKLKSLQNMFQRQMQGFDHQIQNFLITFQSQVDIILQMAKYSNNLNEQISLYSFIYQMSSDTDIDSGIQAQILQRVNQNERRYRLEVLRQNIRIRDFPYPFSKKIQEYNKQIKSKYFEQYCKLIKQRYNTMKTRNIKENERYQGSSSQYFPCYHWTGKKFKEQFNNLFKIKGNKKDQDKDKQDKQEFIKLRAKCLYWDQYSAISMVNPPQFTLYHPQPTKLFLKDENNRQTLSKDDELPRIQIQKKLNLHQMQFHMKTDKYIIKGPKHINTFYHKSQLGIRTIKQFQRVYLNNKGKVKIASAYIRDIKKNNADQTILNSNQNQLLKTQSLSPYGVWDIKLQIQRGYWNEEQIENCILRLQVPCKMLKSENISEDQQINVRKNFEKQYMGNQGPFSVQFSHL